MKLAIMQPYFFPYIGYFQLINAVDKFIFYDDVNYIKRGWINRNRILVNGAAKLITVPCEKASQNKLINDVRVGLNGKSKSKLLETFHRAYGKAPYFNKIFPLVQETLNAKVHNIGELAARSIEEVCIYLGIETEIIPTSSIFNNRELEKADRLINICALSGCQDYINSIGGIDIYDKIYFKKKGINLHFLKSEYIQYKQFGNDFVPWLSIIDVLMFDSKFQVNRFLGAYQIV